MSDRTVTSSPYFRLAVALARHAEVLMAVQQAREERDRLNNDQTEQRIDREQIEAADNEAHVREIMAKLGYLPANGGVL